MFLLSLILLFVYLAGLFWFIRKRYLPNYLLELKPAARLNHSMRLARYASHFLGFLHSLCFFLLFLVVPLGLFYAVNSAVNPQYTPQIDVFVRFYVDLGQLADVEVSGLNNQLLRADSELSIDAPNPVNAMLFGVTRLVELLLTLFVILHLRNMLVSFCNGDTFADGNSQRLSRIGKVLVVAYIFGPFWHWFLSASVFKVIKSSSEAISFMPTSEFSMIGIAVGISVLILSAVIREAEAMQEERELTV